MICEKRLQFHTVGHRAGKWPAASQRLSGALAVSRRTRPMNIAVQDSALTRQATRLAVVDCDIHPQMRSPADLLPFLSGALAQAHADLFQLCAAGAVRDAGLSTHDARCRAPRCMAAERRTAGIGPRFHARAAPRPQWRRDRHPDPAARRGQRSAISITARRSRAPSTTGKSP